MRSLGIREEFELQKLLLSVSKILNPFGLVLRNDIIKDKWYIMMEADCPPEDLTRAELAILGLILRLSKKNRITYIEELVDESGKSRQIISKYLKSLQRNNYILINKNKSIQISTKTNLKIGGEPL